MMQELTALFGQSRWFMEPESFQVLRAQAEKLTAASIQTAKAEYGDRGAPAPAPLVGDVAIISMCGPIVYRSSWLSMYFGLATIETMQYQLRAALADPAVRSIVWRCASPGGMVEMVPEFADEIYAARGQKPLVFVADTLIASCAYWLASQGDLIIATRSSQLGAIGTYCEHHDISGMLERIGEKVTLISHGAHKVDGNPYEPLSDDARAALQAYADEVGNDFEAAVARGRGVTKKVVLDTFGQGQVFTGKNAIALSMADKLGTFDQVLTKATKGRGGLRASLDELTPTLTGEGTPIPLAAKVPARADGVDPDENGECEDGYTKADDGLCYLDVAPADDMEAKATAAQRQAMADQDLVLTTLALLP